MSELTVHSADTPLHLAQDIDSNFRYIAEHLPGEIKTAPAGYTLPLCEIEGLGRLSTTYLGKVRAGSDPIDNFVVRVSMEASSNQGHIGFYKDYALTYESRREPGPVIDRQPTQPEDIEDCPALDVLMLAVVGLAKEFKQIYIPEIDDNMPATEFAVEVAA